MPSRVLFPLLGLAVVAALVGGFLFVTRGSHIELRGEIKKIRTHSSEDNASVVVIDFRFVNPANYPFQVRSVDVILENKDKSTKQGMVVADRDAARYMEFYPAIGQKFNDSFIVREKVAPKQSLDKMVMARFEVPESALQARLRFKIRIEEVDGAVSEIVETPAQ